MLALIVNDSARSLSRRGFAGSCNTVATSCGDKHSECARLLGRLTGGEREKLSSISSPDSDSRGLLLAGDCGDSGEMEAMDVGVRADMGDALAGTSLKRTAGRSMTNDGFFRTGCFTLCAYGDGGAPELDTLRPCPAIDPGALSCSDGERSRRADGGRSDAAGEAEEGRVRWGLDGVDVGGLAERSVCVWTWQI